MLEDRVRAPMIKHDSDDRHAKAKTKAAPTLKLHFMQLFGFILAMNLERKKKNRGTPGQ